MATETVNDLGDRLDTGADKSLSERLHDQLHEIYQVEALLEGAAGIVQAGDSVHRLIEMAQLRLAAIDEEIDRISGEARHG